MENKWYIKIWAMKKYLDLWSINHTLAGCNLAALLLFVDTPFLTSIIIVFLTLLLWEFFEFFHGVCETIQNKISDIVVGMSGFFITHYLMINNVFNNAIFFAIIFLLGLFLGIWSFWAYEKIKK